jgi:hypothetical protein
MRLRPGRVAALWVSCALLSAMLALSGAGSASAEATADDVIGIYKKLGVFAPLSAAGKTPCLCVHGDPDEQAGRMLLYRDTDTYPVDCSRLSSPDAKTCRTTGGSVLSIDQ